MGNFAIADITPHTIMFRLQRRAKQAMIGKCTAHDLRRSSVSSALDAGADLAMVRQLAGHASPTTTPNVPYLKTGAGQ